MTARKKTKAYCMAAILSEIDALNKEAIEIEKAGKALQNKIYKTQSRIYEYFNDSVKVSKGG